MASSEEPNLKRIYTARSSGEAPALDSAFDAGAWAGVDALQVDSFHPKSSEHRPLVCAKVLYDESTIYVHFQVRDRYVICVHNEYQGPVCRDSCAEFFVRPKQEKGYFNFEVNCGGHLLLSYIEDHTRTPDGFKKFTRISWDEASQIRIFHSMSGRVFPEIKEDVVWRIAYAVPFSLFEKYIGSLGAVRGQEWRANFFKCADDCSHPHWASWAPIGEELNFHQPRFFGVLRLG